MRTLRKGQFSAPVFRTVTLFGFILVMALLAGSLFANSGGYVPGFSKERNYEIAFDVPSTYNVVEYVDVYTAGVPVGKVSSLTRPDRDNIRITMELDDAVAPLREGSTVQISEKALTGQPMIRMVQGSGAKAYESGSVLPRDAVKPAVQLRDILASLDKPTRDSLGGVVRSLSESTDGRQKDVSGIFAGLADLGANGDTVLEALGRQSADLMAVSDQLKQVMDAADVGQGQIFQLVSSANQLTAATAGQHTSLEDSIRKLPGVLDSATVASADITELSGALRPVATDLKDAAPDLNDGLNNLPDAAHDIRGSLGPLNDVLNDAPPTLHRTDRFKEETHSFVSPATTVLRDLNPILRYVKPYGKEIMCFVVCFGAALHHFTPDGHITLFIKPIIGPRQLRGVPAKLPGNILGSNAYPAPGSYDKPFTPFTGKFPRVERDN